MKREAMDRLITWEQSSQRKPLIIRGARQVGKTWLIQEFGKQRFSQTAYLSFFDNADIHHVFEGSLNTSRLLDAIRLATGTNAGAPDVLVVFDEVQECPRALSSLKAFCEQRPDVPLIAAGSLLGVSLHKDAPFPVGKVEYLDLFPLSFPEYLEAAGQAAMAEVIRQGNTELLNVFSERFTEELKRYYYIGGMPEVVNTFLRTNSYNEARTVQMRLLQDYEYDFSKHITGDTLERVRLVWNSVPAQLARENKKFIYSAVRASARARNYEEAIQWLVDSGLLYKVNRVTKPGMPLLAYEDKNAFKLYYLDVGLLGATSGLAASTIMNGNSLFTEFKGALTENYVCQALLATGKATPHYWSADNSSGELDYVYDYQGQVYPVEVKAEENLRAKSLRFFVERYNLPRGIRLSLSKYRQQDWLVNIPLYAASALPEIGELPS